MLFLVLLLSCLAVLLVEPPAIAEASDILCPTGWTGAKCDIDVNECWRGVCGKARCRNTPGSYQCICPDSFVFDNTLKKCVDKNECLVNRGGCSHACINTFGSYYCTCPSGYFLSYNGKTCEDINECEESNGLCEYNCTNSIGSYYCSCQNEQYAINTDGITCSRINPCEGNPCSHLCIPTTSSYHCSCASGFELEEDGVSCRQIVACGTLGHPAHGVSSCALHGSVVGQYCNFTCDPGYGMEGSPTTRCVGASTWSTERPMCAIQECPDLFAPNLAVVQPCNAEYNNSCGVKCSEGYYLYDGSERSAQLTCGLDEDGHSVQWSSQPACTEGDACRSSPCQHGGICSLDGEGFMCDCSDTGFTGDQCQRGSIEFPDLPVLSPNRPFNFQIKAKTDGELILTFSHPSALRIRPQTLTFTLSVTSFTVSIEASSPGVYQLSTSLSGPDRLVFSQPLPKIVIVRQPSSTSRNYFRDISPTLRPGCCSFTTSSTCSSGGTLTFLSTCGWDKAENAASSAGIVFASMNNYHLPFSVGRANIENRNRRISAEISDQGQSCTCSGCGGPSCDCYKSDPSNIAIFHSQRTLFDAFLNSTKPNLPPWLKIAMNHGGQSSNRLSVVDHFAEIHPSLDIALCSNFPENIEQGSYIVVKYFGAVDFTLGSSVQTLKKNTEPLCIAVDFCQGPTSPVFLSLPGSQPGDSDFVLHFANRKWTVNPVSIAVGREATKATSFGDRFSSNIRVDGNLNVQGELGARISMQYSMSGQAFIDTGNADARVLDVESHPIVGRLVGKQHLVLISNGKKLYNLHSLPSAETHLSLNGSSKNVQCGLETLQGTMLDIQDSERSGSLSSVLEIPPKLLYGQRSNFECEVKASVFSDTKFAVSGLELSSVCHDLRLSSLLFSGMTNRVYFGRRAHSTCRHNADTSVLSKYSVIGVASATELVQLGHFVHILADVGHVLYGLDPASEKYDALIEGASVRMFGTSIQTDITLKDSLLKFTAAADLYNQYSFTLTVTADATFAWSNLTFSVQGKATDEVDTNSFVAELQNGTESKLVSLSETAVKRVQTAELGKAEALRIARELKFEKEVVKKTSTNLKGELTIILKQINSLKGTIAQKKLEISRFVGLPSSLSRQLQGTCRLQVCPQRCVPGVSNTTGNDTDLEILGQRSKITLVEKPQRVIVGNKTVPCSSWKEKTDLATTCGCTGNSFVNCECDIFSVTSHQSVPSLCNEDVYGVRDVKVPEEKIEVYVRSKLPAVVHTPNAVLTSCDSRLPDETCVKTNSICSARRRRLLEAQPPSLRQAAALLLQVQDAEQQIAAAEVRKGELEKRLSLQKEKEKQLEQDCATLTSSTAVQNLTFVKEINREGLFIAKRLKTIAIGKLFSIKSVSFQTEVAHSSPTTLPLKITVSVGSSSSVLYVSMLFDFNKLESSFIRAQSLVSNAVLQKLVGAPRRKRRQTIPGLESGLANQNALFETMAKHFKSLSLKLGDLDNAQNNYNHLGTIVSANLGIPLIPTGATSSQSTSPPTTSTASLSTTGSRRPLATQASTSTNRLSFQAPRVNLDNAPLNALNQAKSTYARNVQDQAAVATSNLLPKFQAEVNLYVSKEKGLFGTECSGMPDCFVSSVEIVDDIVRTAPLSLTGNIRNKLPTVEANLQIVSSSTTISLRQAKENIDSMVEVIHDALDLKFWSAKPPTITVSPDSDVHVLENGTLVLKCFATSDHPVRYSWVKDGIQLEVNNASVLTVARATRRDAGNYTCLAANHAGTSESPWSIVHVLVPPRVYTHPSPTTAIVDDPDPIRLKCNATSAPNPQYRWYFKTLLLGQYRVIPGAVNNEHHIPTPQIKHQGLYICEAWIKGPKREYTARSSPALVTVVPPHVSQMSIPITFELDFTQNRRFARNTQSSILSVVNNAVNDQLSSSHPSVRPVIKDLVISRPSTSKPVTEVSLKLEVKDGLGNSLPSDTIGNQFVEVTELVSLQRKELDKTVNKLKPVLLSPNTYQRSRLGLVGTSDKSEYRFGFGCSSGQALDGNFILCKRCPPGKFQSKTTRPMKDALGIELKVDQQTCLPCPRGTYQPDAGKTRCIHCPSRFSLVEGAISRDTCIDNPCQINNGGCSQNCINAPLGFYCSCRKGYQLNSDRKTCKDIDECVTDTHGCSQGCTNTEGSFVCSCPPGYLIQEDGANCGVLCKPSCKNGGKCIRSNVCACTPGWTGPDCGQAIDTACGGHFHVGFFENEYETNLIKRVIVVHSRGSGTAKLSSLDGRLKLSGTIQSNVPLVLTIAERRGSTRMNFNTTYAVFVNASAAVNVFGGDIGTGSTGAFAIYPKPNVPRNEYRYLVMAAHSTTDKFKSAVVFTSLDGSTASVRMRKVVNGRPLPSKTVSVQTLYPIAEHDEGDLTGTEIVSSSPLAVYSGHQCARVPEGRQRCDKLVEQIPPVSALGRRYIVTGFVGRSSDTVVKIVAAFDDTAVTISCRGSAVNLDTSMKHIFSIKSNEGCFISASKRIMVAQFTIGKGTLPGGRGDPSMVILPHLDDLSDHASLYSFPQDLYMRHFITIITKESAFSNKLVRLNGRTLTGSSNVIRIPTDSDLGSYVAIRMSVGTGIQNVVALGSKCLVVAYGYAPSSAYSYASKVSTSQFSCRD